MSPAPTTSADAGRPSAAVEAPGATDEVLVLDFGGQYSQLIARRVRDSGVFAELLVAPALQTEGKQLQREQHIGMAATGGAVALVAD